MVLLRSLFVLIAPILVVTTAVPASAQSVEADVAGQVVLSGDLVVPRGRTVGEVVVLHGSATVLGVVDGDVIVLDGPATIAGQVAGDVVVLDGQLLLRDTAQVAGNVLSGDRVEREEGSEVAGDVREGFRVSLEGPVAALGALLASVAIAVSLLIVMAMIVLLAPRGVDRLGVATHTAPFAAAGWGLVVAIAIPVVSLVLVASVLGLPLGIALLLGLGLLFLSGLAAAALGIGRAIVAPPRGRVGALFAGWAIVAVVGLVPVLNAIAWGLLAVFGLGVMLVAAWRGRGTSKHRAGGVAASPSPGSAA